MCFHLPRNCWHQKQLFSHFLFWSYALAFYYFTEKIYIHTSTEELNHSKDVLKYQTLCSQHWKMVRCHVFYVWCFVLFGALSTLAKKSVTSTKEKYVVWQSTQYQTLQMLWKTSDKCIQIWLMYSTVSTFCEQNSLLYCCVFFKVEYSLLSTVHALSS